MANLQELQKQLDNVEDVIALITQVADEKVPQLENSINNIVNKIENGFNTGQLETQAKTAINAAISKSDFIEVVKQLNSFSTKISNTADLANSYKNSFNLRWTSFIALVTLIIGLAIGWGIEFWRIDEYQDKITKYQNTIAWADSYAKYINSSCKIKKDYGKFINQDIDCGSHWINATDILDRK